MNLIRCLIRTLRVLLKASETDMSKEHFETLKKAYPGRRLLIVSNTAGALSYDSKRVLASELEQITGVTVLSHQTKKPGCGPEIMEYFRNHPETGVTSPSQVAVVGDRLSTDIMLANTMGSYGIWVKSGVVPLQQKSIVSITVRSCHNPGLLTCVFSSPGSNRDLDHTFLPKDMLLHDRPTLSSSSEAYELFRVWKCKMTWTALKSASLSPSRIDVDRIVIGSPWIRSSLASPKTD